MVLSTVAAEVEVAVLEDLANQLQTSDCPLEPFWSELGDAQTSMERWQEEGAEETDRRLKDELTAAFGRSIGGLTDTSSIVLLFDTLDRAGPIPNQEKANFSAGSFIVNPSPQFDGLVFKPGNIFDINPFHDAKIIMNSLGGVNQPILPHNRSHTVPGYFRWG